MPHRAVINIVQDRPFLVCAPEDQVGVVAAHMKKHMQDAVLVVSPEGELLGICSERDLCHKVLAWGLPSATPVGEVMTAQPLAVGPEMRFGSVLHLMYESGVRHMPVVDAAGHPLGLVSSRDALGLEIFRFADELGQRERIAELL